MAVVDSCNGNNIGNHVDQVEEYQLQIVDSYIGVRFDEPLFRLNQHPLLLSSNNMVHESLKQYIKPHFMKLNS
ncbi:hypothetical protein BLOT_004915 [Blomia tropicalis]|nr:hypothetical protein BLOT_004915 [Blomia tropicalis]